MLLGTEGTKVEVEVLLEEVDMDTDADNGPRNSCPAATKIGSSVQVTTVRASTSSSETRVWGATSGLHTKWVALIPVNSRRASLLDPSLMRRVYGASPPAHDMSEVMDSVKDEGTSMRMGPKSSAITVGEEEMGGVSRAR